VSQIIQAISNVNQLDDLSRKKSIVHDLHPLSKFSVTIIFLVTVISFDKYNITGLIPFIFYPLIMLLAADIPVSVILKKVVIVEPLIIGIGILNPLILKDTINIFGLSFSIGWVIFFSILIKCSLTVAAGFTYLVTTGMDRIALTMRMLRVPKIFVLQIILTYRYISILSDEVARITKAYNLRSINKKGIKRIVWGSLVGQLILRTLNRADRIYNAMCLRHFSGEYHTGYIKHLALKDVLFIIICSTIIITARIFNFSVLIGNIVFGGRF